MAIIRDPKYRILMYYYSFAGICVGFYATFLNKLVRQSLPAQELT
jgi:hypothetical protein